MRSDPLHRGHRNRQPVTCPLPTDSTETPRPDRRTPPTMRTFKDTDLFGDVNDAHRECCTVVRRLRQAYQRTEDAAARVRDRLACRRRGHLWDTDRPAGPIHKRDICWRCNAVREEKR